MHPFVSPPSHPATHSTSQSCTFLKEEREGGEKEINRFLWTPGRQRNKGRFIPLKEKGAASIHHLNLPVWRDTNGHLQSPNGQTTPRHAFTLLFFHASTSLIYPLRYHICALRSRLNLERIGRLVKRKEKKKEGGPTDRSMKSAQAPITSPALSVGQKRFLFFFLWDSAS